MTPTLAVALAIAVTPFVSEQGEFSAAFPGKPTVREIPIRENQVAGVRYFYSHSTDDAVYVVQYVDLRLTAGTTVDDALRSSRQHTEERLAVLGAAIVSETSIRRAGHPGRDWVIHFSDGTTGVNRVLLVDTKRLYTVIYSPRADRKRDPGEGERFLESFTYTGPKERR